MKSLNLFLIVVAVAAAVSYATTSCSKEYDLSNGLDTEITVGGDSLSLPIGSTEKMYLSSFMDISDMDYIIQDDQGHYLIQFSENISEKVSVEDYIDDTSVEGIVSHSSFDFQISSAVEMPADDISASSLAPVKIDINEEIIFAYSFEGAKDHGLIDLDSVVYKDAHIFLDLNLSAEGALLPSPLKVEVRMSYDKRYRLENAVHDGELLLFEGSMDASGNVNFPIVDLRRIELELDPSQVYEFEDLFVLQDMTIYFESEDLPALIGKNMTAEMTFSVGARNEDKVYAEALYGIIDKKLDAVTEEISLEDFPDYLSEEGVVMDFYNPYTTVSLSTNMGIPICVDATLTPLSRDPLEIPTLSAPVSDDPSVVENALFYLSNVRPEDLDPGTEWVQTDIASLLQPIPEKITVQILPYTDITTPNHYIDCNADYTIEGDFTFTLPFAFGDKLSLPLRDTIYDIPDLFKELIASTDISLGGTVENSFPVNIELSFFFVDQSGAVLDILSTSDMLDGASVEDVAVTSDFEVTVSASSLAENIAGIVVQFRLLPGETPGILFSDRSYVKASLVVRAPGGLSFDIGDDTDN